MEPLKEMFNRSYFQKLAAEFKNVYPRFEKVKFIGAVTTGLEALSLNQRLRHATQVLNVFLPEDFPKTIQIMKQVIKKCPRGYTSLLFPDYVGQFGHNHFAISMDALKYFTCYGSTEFAVREFLKK